MFTSVASANWYLRCDPPVTKAAAKAADTSAKAVVTHLDNIQALATGQPRVHFYNIEESTALVRDRVRFAYQHITNGQCGYANVATKPGKPYVTVWDRLSTANKTRVANLGLAPE